MRVDIYDAVVLWAAAAGQCAFVVLWATQRWWTSNVGRALMAKSTSLAVILSASVWAHYHGPLPLTIGRALFTAVAVAILGQLGTLVWEVFRAHREQRRVSGTDRRKRD